MKSERITSRRQFRVLALRSWLLIFFLAGPAISGLISFLETFRDGEGGVDGLEGAASVAVGPVGAYVYATGQAEDTLAVFARDATNDTLTFVQVLRDETDGVFGLQGAAAVAAAPDGGHVYTAAFDDDAIGVFRRHPVLAGLEFTGVVKENGVGGVFGLDGASAAVVSRDGGHLLVAGKLDGALTVFARDASVDDLALVDFEGAGGVDLSGASAIGISPDNAHVYVTAEAANSLVVFLHHADLDTVDALTFLAEYTDGVDGMSGLGFASSVAVSPDGNHVYATGRLPGSLVVFERDSSTGLLTKVQILNVHGGIPSLDGSSAVVLPPDGRMVLVASPSTDSLTVFQRNRITGLLSLQSVLVDDLAGIDGLGGATALDVSGDRQNLYVAGTSDNAITSFLLSHLNQGDPKTRDPSR